MKKLPFKKRIRCILRWLRRTRFIAPAYHLYGELGFTENISNLRRLRRIIRWIGRSKPVVWIIGWFLYLYIWLVGKSGSFEVHGGEEFDKMIKDNDGGIFVAWHGRALMLPYFWRNTRQMKALVSPHADGRVIAEMLRKFAILPIRGSSDKRSFGAAMDVIRELNQGTVVSIISDGPRGPRMRLNKSVIYFAQKTGKPVMGFTYSSERAKVMDKIWDAMLLPMFFRKGVVFGTKPLFVPKEATEEELEEIRQNFEDELNRLTMAADVKCQVPVFGPSDVRHEKT